MFFGLHHLQKEKKEKNKKEKVKLGKKR